MVRTAASANRATGGKSAKSLGKSGSSGSGSSSAGGDKPGGSGGNSVHPRETPSWQKPISNFFQKTDRNASKQKTKDIDMKEPSGSSSTLSPTISSKDMAEAGSSKDIYRLRNVHIDNNNDEDSSNSNNNNSGAYNNNNNNNIPDHNSHNNSVSSADSNRSNESMDTDCAGPSTSGYQANKVNNKQNDEGTASGKNKENLDDNKQVKKRVQEFVVAPNPRKKLRPDFYKYLEELDSGDT